MQIHLAHCKALKQPWCFCVKPIGELQLEGLGLGKPEDLAQVLLLQGCVTHSYTPLNTHQCIQISLYTQSVEHTQETLIVWGRVTHDSVSGMPKRSLTAAVIV